MGTFLQAFGDELVKVARGTIPPSPKLSPAQIAAVKKALTRGATGTVGAAALLKLVNPGTDLGEALASGGAIVGGGSLGRHVARRAGLGRRGRGWGGLAGSLAGLRAMQKHRKAKRSEQ